MSLSVDSHLNTNVIKTIKCFISTAITHPFPCQQYNYPPLPTFSLLTIQLPAAGASPPETGAAAATAAPPAGTDANFS
jgi:hypothetical protein